MSQTLPIRAVPLPGPSAAPIIRATKLNKSFVMGGSVVQVLKDADLSVAPGEFVAIEGRSGSGKSTLLHILGALDTVESGSAEFGGHPYLRRTAAELGPVFRMVLGPWVKPAVWSGLLASVVLLVAAFMKPDAFPAGRTPPWSWAIMPAGFVALLLLVRLVTWAVIELLALPEDRTAADIRNRQFGFVFQFYHLLPELNVVENTMLSPMIEHSWLGFFKHGRPLRERAIRILTELGMEHRLTHRPNQLSGGERQRVAIARALMNEPKVLFADEPTGNLDAETGQQIMGVLERLHREKGQTIVMVTHDRGLARKTDRVLVLRHGKLEPAVP